MKQNTAIQIPPPEDPGAKRSDLVVYVFNVVEDEWSFISSITDAVKRFEYISESEDAADAYFMSMGGEKDFIFVSPKSMSPEFQTYCKKIMGFKNGQIIVPTLRSHLICEDLISDAKSFEILASKAKQYKRVVLVSYSASKEFYSLKEYLERLGIVVFAPEAPELSASWTVNFYGSKSGIRQLAQQSKAEEPDFIMPEGIICVGMHDAAQIAAHKYIKQKGVVIKTNKGSGGSGVLIFRDGELPYDYRECQKAILDQMSQDRYWDVFPIVIEDLVNINFAMAGGFPNVEFKIHKNGRVEMLFVCACQVTPKGKFFGIDINEDILNDRIQTRLEDTGYYIGEKYAAAGYRGHFDVDMIAAKNGQIYVCESNTRNTGGTDTFKIAKNLLGKDFMDDGYTFSRSHPHWLKPKKYTLTDIFELLEPLLFNHSTKEGLIINSENGVINGKLIYTILGKNRKRAYEIETVMIQKLLELDFAEEDLRLYATR